MALILTASQVAALLTLDDCIDAVEGAFRAHGEGMLHPPGLLSEHVEHGAFHIKTSTIGRYFAAKYLAPKRPATVTVFGCGGQGRVQLEAIRRVADVQRVYAVDTNAEAAASLGAAPSPEQVRESDIIITCTTARSPILHLGDVKPGAFVAAVGADNPAKSEIDPKLLAATVVVSDITEQAATIGDLHHAIDAGLVTREHVRAELGEVVAGTKRGRTSDDEIVIFDSTGAGFQDTAAVAIVYERARERGIGIEVRLA